MRSQLVVLTKKIGASNKRKGFSVFVVFGEGRMRQLNSREIKLVIGGNRLHSFAKHVGNGVKQLGKVAKQVEGMVHQVGRDMRDGFEAGRRGDL